MTNAEPTLTRFADLTDRDIRGIRKLVTGGGPTARLVREMMIGKRWFSYYRVERENRYDEYETNSYRSYRVTKPHLENTLNTLVGRKVLVPLTYNAYASDKHLYFAPTTLEVLFPPQKKPAAPVSFGVGVAGVDGLYNLTLPGFRVPPDRVAAVLRWFGVLAAETPDDSWARAVQTVFYPRSKADWRWFGVEKPEAFPVLLLIPGPRVVIARYPGYEENSDFWTRDSPYRDWVATVDVDKLAGGELETFAQDPAVYFRLYETLNNF